MKKLKKILCVFTLVLFTINVNSQISIDEKIIWTEVGKVKRGGQKMAYIEYTVSKRNNDTTYFFTFKNEKYTTIVDFQHVSFVNSKTLSDLYKIMKSAFLEENKKDKDFMVSFKLGDKDVFVSNRRSFGLTLVVFHIYNGPILDSHYISLGESEVEKLFGK